MDVKTFLKKYNLEKEPEKEEHDASLRGHALERTQRLKRPNAGTPFDWEDWEQRTERVKDDNSL